MGFQKKKSGISDDKLQQFLNNGKDSVIQEGTAGESITENENVNVNSKRIQNQGSVTNLIAKGATFESNFSRQTYYVHNDLIQRLDKLTKKAPRGEKTKIINAALEQYLNNL